MIGYILSLIIWGIVVLGLVYSICRRYCWNICV